MKKHVDFNEFTEEYDKLLTRNTSFFTKEDKYFAKYKIDIIKRHTVHPVKRIWEFGCGTGRNIPWLHIAFPQAQITGTDISTASIDVARKNCPYASFETEKEAEKEDIILMAGVLHHVSVEARASILREVKNYLTEKGILWIFEHNPYNILTKKIVKDCPYDADAVLLKPSELFQLLKKEGYISITKGYCLFIPPYLSKIVFLERYLAWLPLGGQYYISCKRDL